MVLALLVVAWLAFNRSRPRGAPRSADRSVAPQVALEDHSTLDAPTDTRVSGARELPLSPRSTELEGTVSSGSLFEVRSSSGIPLLAIERETDAGAWQRIELDRGHCTRASLELPRRIRAAGHLAQAVAAGEERAMLEPDALLVLEASDLKHCTSSIGPFDDYVEAHEDVAAMRPELLSTMAWGWVSGERWAIAVSSTPAPLECPLDQRGAVVLRWRDGRRADVRLEVKAGARGTWSVPCAQRFAAAPLDAHIERCAGEVGGSLRLAIGRVLESESPGHEEVQPWGRVVFYGDGVYWLDRTLPRGGSDLHLDSVPTGTRLVLVGMDEATHCYGRLSFVHNGEPLTLALRPAFRVNGKLVSAADSATVKVADISWHAREGGQDVWGWQANVLALTLPADGRFTLRGPKAPLLDERLSLEAPAQIALHISAPGFEEFEREFATQGAASLECGELRLVPTREQLRLAPGHGLSVMAVRWQVLLASSAPDVWWSIRDAAPVPDGGLAIFLLRGDAPDSFRTQDSGERAWPSVPAERILIHVVLGARDEPWAFERLSDGAYAAVARQEHEIEAECRALPEAEGDWIVGWQWRDLWGALTRIPAAQLGERTWLRFSAPLEGASLYWFDDGMPPSGNKRRGGSVPLDAALRTVVLQ